MSGQQQTLDGQPHRAGLDRRVITDGQIDHATWHRIRTESGFVGTCPTCGDYLRPEKPEVVAGRTDYLARCRNPACGHELLAPGGRVGKPRTRKGA